MKTLSKALREAFSKEGVLAAVMVSRDGLLIEGYAEEEMDLEAVGAMVSRGIDYYEGVSSELAGQDLDWVLLKAEGRSVLIKGLMEEAFLVFLLERGEWLNRLDGAVEEWLSGAGDLSDVVAECVVNGVVVKQPNVGDKNG